MPINLDHDYGLALGFGYGFGYGFAYGGHGSTGLADYGPGGGHGDYGVDNSCIYGLGGYSYGKKAPDDKLTLLELIAYVDCA